METRRINRFLNVHAEDRGDVQEHLRTAMIREPPGAPAPSPVCRRQSDDGGHRGRAAFLRGAIASARPAPARTYWLSGFNTKIVHLVLRRSPRPAHTLHCRNHQLKVYITATALPSASTMLKMWFPCFRPRDRCPSRLMAAARPVTAGLGDPTRPEERLGPGGRVVVGEHGPGRVERPRRRRRGGNRPRPWRSPPRGNEMPGLARQVRGPFGARRAAPTWAWSRQASPAASSSAAARPGSSARR